MKTAGRADGAGLLDHDRANRAGHFGLALAAIAVGALTLRIALALYRPTPYFNSDATFFLVQGRLLADGHGFAEPFEFLLHGRLVATAFHPPMLALVYAVPDWLGADGLGAARVTTSLIGTGTVVAVGLLGRELAGAHVGLLAAAIAAVTPNLLAPDTNLQSEGLAALFVTLALLAGYRLLARPRLLTASALGAALGAAGLTRPESLGLAVFILVPLVRTHTLGHGARLRLVLVTLAVAVVLVGPWVVRSLTRFDQPVPFSTNGTAVIGVTNCSVTYSGALLGDWSPRCLAENLHRASRSIPEGADESVTARTHSDLGARYLRSHLGDFFGRVVWARIGRTWSLFRPFDLAAARNDEAKLHSELVVGVLFLWASLGFAAVGIRRVSKARAFPLLPLIGPAIIVTLVSIVAYGTPRFRVIAEPSLAVLAAIGVAALWERLRGRAPSVR